MFFFYLKNVWTRTTRKCKFNNMVLELNHHTSFVLCKNIYMILCHDNICLKQLGRHNINKNRETDWIQCCCDLVIAKLTINKIRFASITMFNNPSWWPVFWCLDLPYFSLYFNLALRTPILITSKYDIFKGKINGTFNNKTFKYDFHVNGRSY